MAALKADVSACPPTAAAVWVVVERQQTRQGWRRFHSMFVLWSGLIPACVWGCARLTPPLFHCPPSRVPPPPHAPLLQPGFRAQVRAWMAQEGYVAGRKDAKARAEELARSPALE